MKKHKIKKLDVYKFEKVFENMPVSHFVTCKQDFGTSEFNLSYSSNINFDEVIINRQLLAEELKLKPENFVFQQQEHTNNAFIITDKERSSGFYDHQDGICNNDALITNQKGICLTVFGADCVPILLYDSIKKVVAAIHAGWRGTSAKIVEKAIKKMQIEFNCEPKNILAAIGPSISTANYEVDEKVYNAFKENHDNCNLFFDNGKIEGKYQLDLWRANQLQLLKMGVETNNIEIAEICTYDNHNEFFSARRGDKGRFLTGIMLI